MEKIRVLFVCTHNAARSQIAEAFLNAVAGERFEAESEGLEPRELNPLVLNAMQEIGFDLSGKTADSVFELYKEGGFYDYVISVCEPETEQQCPVFPGTRKRLHWPFPDPAKLEGGYEERLKETRKIRDGIRARIESWAQGFDEDCQPLNTIRCDHTECR